MGGQNTSPNKLGAFWNVLPDRVGVIPGPIIVENPDGGGGGGGGELVENPDGGGSGGGGPIVENPDAPAMMRVHFSATVAFRLFLSSGGPGDFTLNNFPPLVDWAATMRAATFNVTLSTAPAGAVYEATRVSEPNSAIWTKLFKPTTKVTPQRPQDYNARDKRAINSYPRREVAEVIRRLHAGAQYQTADTVVSDKIAATRLQSTLGDLRVSRVQLNGISNTLNNLVSLQNSQPQTWAVRRQDRNGLIAAANRPAADMVQLKNYFSRLAELDAPATAVPAPTFPDLDFHQMAALALVQPAVARALGLVLDFFVDVPQSAIGDGDMQLIVNYDGANVHRNDVFYPTAYRLGAQLFEIRALGNLLDGDGRYLRLGDEAQFSVENGLDVDSAAIKAADAELHFAQAPKDDDLPALKTTGFGVNRIDAAFKLGEIRRRDRQRYNAAFNRNSDTFEALAGAQSVGSPQFINHAEDLVRGYRFDVWDESQAKWFSLHRRSGRYLVGRQAPLELVVNDGEGFATMTPTRPRRATLAQAVPTDEYYLSETLMRWSGWSLSVPRVGTPITNDDLVLGRDGAGAPAFPRPDGMGGEVVAQFGQAHELPRLRFGRSYRFRARVVDTAGNSVPFTDNTPPGELGDAVTEPTTYRRFDPMESPTLVLRERPGPGESIYELVVRSDDRLDNSADDTQRLVPPPPTSQWLAEMHGAFDAAIDDDKAAELYDALLEHREGKNWAPPLAIPISAERPNEFFVPKQVPQDNVPLPYLSDPAVRRALIANLPGATSAQWVTFGGIAWPSLTAAKLILTKSIDVTGPGSYVPVVDDGDTLTIALTKGDVRTIRISSALAQPGSRIRSVITADDFGLFPWMLEEALAKNPLANPAAVEAIFRFIVTGGGHRAISPPQEVRLIHAVRRPLTAPAFKKFRDEFDSVVQLVRGVGETTASLITKLKHSPRSTGRLDISATWNRFFDAGPGGSNPTIPENRSTQVFSRELDRDSVAPGLTVDEADANVSVGDSQHEFGDTRHYRVAYHAKATTAFLPYFRESKLVFWQNPQAQEEFAPLTEGGANVSDAPVTVVGRQSGTNFVEGVDYRVDRPNGRLYRLRFSNNTFRIRENIDVSFVPGVIDWVASPHVMHVPSTARPDLPKVHSIVPSFRWNREIRPATTLSPRVVQSSRSGGGLRVWLDRPWWSSGEDEYLGVVVTPSVLAIPDDDSRQFVSQSGTDPTNDSRDSQRFLTPANFTGNELAAATTTLAESGRLVTVVPYKVHYHSGRDQWYADITVNTSLGATATSGYFPFVRLALVRYQPFSVSIFDKARPTAGPGELNVGQTLSLSPVALTDFVQVAPQRDVTIFRSGNDVTVTVRGEAYTRMQTEQTPARPFTDGRGPTRMVATLQSRDTTITDPDLGWENVGGNAIVANQSGRTSILAVAGVQNRTDFTWRGTVRIPAGARRPAYRILVEEYELHYGDANGTTNGQLQLTGNPGGPDPSPGGFIPRVPVPDAPRCVFQDMIPLEGL